MRKKVASSAVVSAILASSVVFAQQFAPYSAGYSSGFQGFLGSVVAGILNWVYFVFGLQFLGFNDPMLVTAFIRVNIWLITFVLVYTVITRLSGLFGHAPAAAAGAPAAPLPGLRGLNRTGAAILSISMAFLATFTISPSAILAIGGIFGLLTAMIFLAIPFALVGLVWYVIPSAPKQAVLFKICAIIVAMWLLSMAQPLFGGKIIVPPFAQNTAAGVFTDFGNIIDILMLFLVILLMYYIFIFLFGSGQPPIHPNPHAGPANREFANLLDSLGAHGPARKFRMFTGTYDTADVRRDIEMEREVLINMVNVAKETLSEVKRPVWYETWLDELYERLPNKGATPPTAAFPWDQPPLLRLDENRQFMIAAFRRLVVSPALRNRGYIYHEASIRGIAEKLTEKIAELKRLKGAIDPAHHQAIDDWIKKLDAFERGVDGLVERFRKIDEGLQAVLPTKACVECVRHQTQIEAQVTALGPGGIPAQLNRAQWIATNIVTPLLKPLEHEATEAGAFINKLA